MSSPPDALREGEAHALVALGANLGDRRANLVSAVDALRALPATRVVALSGAYDTAPVGPPDQPRYLNAAVLLATALEPKDLLGRLLAIERELGRRRSESRWTAREIDLDLVLHGESTLADGDLVLPHPRFRERAFVLLPAAEIAGWMRDPVSGERLESLLRACPGRSDAVRIGPLDESDRA